MGSGHKKPYGLRLFIGLVAYSVLLLGAFAVFQYHREKEFKAAELNTRLQTVNDYIFSELKDGHADFSAQDIIAESNIPDLRISIIDRKGNVVYDNSLDKLPGTNHLDRKEIAEALAHGTGYTQRRHSTSTDNTYFYSAKSNNGYIVRTAIPYTITLTQLLDADYTFLWFMIAATAIMCIIGYYSTRKIGNEADAERDKEHRRALFEQKEKIRIKHQLTNNISHELKTPVAAMQACLETLLDHPDMAKDKQTDFIRRCYDANERLNRLLRDVSLITRLDEGHRNISREQVNIGKIVAEVCAEYEPMATKKGIILINRISTDKTILGNEGLLISVFQNLIANAIAYSGGSEVDLWNEGDTFHVADNGVGVGNEHLPRLFERFYRVDKGRSRQLGGTGLGLSIVKNAVMFHNGNITVQNRKPSGLQFTFQLK